MEKAIRLTWRERVGYCSGEVAQNLIYQTVSIWLLFYYTNVYGLKPATAAVMFLIVRIIDVLWDPFVGTLVDKSYPRWGKYRSWLIIGGIPMAGAAVLCFWNGFNSSLLYAYVTYIALSMCFTLTSVPYGALGDSLTRDVNELTILTSVRMLFANFAGLLIKTLPAHSLVPSGSLFVTKTYSTQMRVSIKGVKNVKDGGNLLLKNEQTLPLNIFVNRQQLNEVMDMKGKMNIILSDDVLLEEDIAKFL